MKFWFSGFVLLFSFGIFALPASAEETKNLGGAFCKLKDARINESSGLAASREYSAARLLVTHNDSGGEAKLFYINLKGETVAEISLQNATNIDWEDIAISGKWIYVGDIGDNWRNRKSITIYRLREPKFNPKKIGQKLEVSCEKMILKYPDAPCDAETLMSNSKDEIFVVSKNGGASRFYKTPKPFENNATQTLEKIGEYSFKGDSARSYLATGGDLSSDETRFVVRTYTHAFEWNLPADKNWKTALKSTPRTWELTKSKQGEAICYSADTGSFFSSEEGKNSPIYHFAPVPIPPSKTNFFVARARAKR